LVALVEQVEMESLVVLELRAVLTVQPEVVDLVAVVARAGPVELQMLEMVA
jgi:hypothetical protein